LPEFIPGDPPYAIGADDLRKLACHLLWIKLWRPALDHIGDEFLAFAVPDAKRVAVASAAACIGESVIGFIVARRQFARPRADSGCNQFIIKETGNIGSKLCIPFGLGALRIVGDGAIDKLKDFIAKMERKMSNLVHNEQTKMTANLFNNLGVASLVTGVLAPVFSVRSGATPIGVSGAGYPIFDGLSINALGGLFLGVVVCVLCGWTARGLLTKLKE